MDIMIGSIVEVTNVKTGTLKWERLSTGSTIVSAMIQTSHYGDFHNIDFGDMRSRIVTDGNTAVYMPAAAVYSVTGWVGEYRSIVFQAFEVPRFPILRVFLGRNAAEEAKKYHESVEAELDNPSRYYDEGLVRATHASAGLGV